MLTSHQSNNRTRGMFTARRLRQLAFKEGFLVWAEPPKPKNPLFSRRGVAEGHDEAMVFGYE